MTPAIKLLNKCKIDYTLHEYTWDSQNKNYGMEAAKSLGISECLVYKTLVVSLNTGELVVVIIPVSRMLDINCWQKF